ncbi:DUF2218 domain-containing protein [Marinactinospora rubrisoli]|uniref:DUF2218 domain-containing protein n=1 Tax=Marinactinospora rubrisoli TaxID=2715399 RepID=A0ABW2KP06_9ACTN
MSRTEARVATERPHRYARQLAAHMGRRIEAVWDDAAGHGRLSFPFGEVELTAEPGALLLAASGAAADLERLEDVLGRHLVRFGTREELVVRWVRDTGGPGLVQRGGEAAGPSGT